METPAEWATAVNRSTIPIVSYQHAFSLSSTVSLLRSFTGFIVGRNFDLLAYRCQIRPKNNFVVSGSMAVIGSLGRSES